MDWKGLIKQKGQQRIRGVLDDSAPNAVKDTANKAANLTKDAKDVAQIVAQASAGNWVGAAVTTVKNKRFRRWIIGIVVVILVIISTQFLLTMTQIIGAADMFKHPFMLFGAGQTITQTDPNGQTETVDFNALATKWAKMIRWGFLGENTGLTKSEIATVNKLQLNLSYGLLETFYEIGARQGAKNPQKSLAYITQLLQPSAINFKPVQLRKVGYKQGKKYYYYVTQEVLQNITRYNGFWVTHWQIITESDGSQIVVYQPSTLQTKDYSPLYNAEQVFDFKRTTYDQQILWGQALVLDQKFYDPAALPVLQLLDGGEVGGTGGAPSKGEPMPKPQVIAILQQAIKIDGVPQSWLSELEIIVSHEDPSGNPYAVDPILVDGEHASGLMQMLPSTFWGDHVAGYNDIWNPLDNTVAAIRHIQGAWGNPDNIPGVLSGTYTGY